MALLGCGSASLPLESHAPSEPIATSLPTVFALPADAVAVPHDVSIHLTSTGATAMVVVKQTFPDFPADVHDVAVAWRPPDDADFRMVRVERGDAVAQIGWRSNGERFARMVKWGTSWRTAYYRPYLATRAAELVREDRRVLAPVATDLGGRGELNVSTTYVQQFELHSGEYSVEVPLGPGALMDAACGACRVTVALELGALRDVQLRGPQLDRTVSHEWSGEVAATGTLRVSYSA